MDTGYIAGGLQFEADEIQAYVLSNLEGIEKYLASELIKGIEPIYAKKLIMNFRFNVFSVTKNDPLKLRSVAMISGFKANKIINS